MDAYLELQLLPDPEFPPAMLMNALFAKLHRALVSHGEGRIGISFPDVGKKAGQLGQRLRRRLIRRKGIGEDEAREAIPNSAAQLLALPSLLVTSQSTQQQFRLFIEHLPVQAETSPGSFTSYGLSNEASIPWF